MYTFTKELGFYLAAVCSGCFCGTHVACLVNIGAILLHFSGIGVCSVDTYYAFSLLGLSRVVVACVFQAV